MKFNKKRIIAMFFLISIFLVASLISATYFRSSPQYSYPGFSGYTGVSPYIMYDQSMCEKAGQDFIVQIAPLGCTPAVVRSDLLEEQDVAVFCQLAATKINPLIEVEAIENIYFSGKYPPEVRSIGFHPAKAALGYAGSRLNSPLINNIGYAVIVLKRQPNESAMPDFVRGNLTAKIRYDIKNAFGVGRANFYLPALNDNEWRTRNTQYSFWNGRGYLRAESIEEDAATISIYSDISSRTSLIGDPGYEKSKITSVRLKEGEISNKIYLPGMGFCMASMQLRLTDLTASDTRARLKINADIFEVAKNEEFLDGDCKVTGLTKQGLTQEVNFWCREDQRRKNFNAKISPRVSLEIDGKEAVEYEVGDILDDHGDRRIFLGYVGKRKSDDKEFIVPVLARYETKQEFLDSVDMEVLQTYTSYIEEGVKENIDFLRVISDLVASSRDGAIKIFSTIVRGVDYGDWVEIDEEKETVFISEKFRAEAFGTLSLPYKIYKSIVGEDWEPPTYRKINIKFISLAGPINRWDIDEIKGLDPQEEEFKSNYTKAMEDYQLIRDYYSGEEYSENNEKSTLGEEAFFEQIKLSYKVEQFRTVMDLCGEFKSAYPDSSKVLTEYCDNPLRFSSKDSSIKEVFVGGKVRTISFEGIYEPTFEEYGVEVIISGAEENYNGKRRIRKDGRAFLSETESIILKDLGEDYAEFDVRDVKESVTQALSYNQRSLKISLDNSKVVGEKRYRIEVKKINLKSFAKVTVVPSIDYAGTEADFSFNVGIEKRAIQLNPDKAKEKIEKLEKNINKWSNVSESLGEIVQFGKKACLTVGAGLTIINFLENAKGKGIARQSVMRGQGGWYERCIDMVGQGEFKSQEECLIKKSTEIDADVEKWNKIQSDLNDDLKEMRERHSDPEAGFFKETMVNTDEFTKELADDKVNKTLQTFINNYGRDFSNPKDPTEKIDISEMGIILSYNGSKNNNYDVEELREIELYMNIINSDASDRIKNMSRERLYSSFSDIRENSKRYAEQSTWSRTLGISASDISVLRLGDKIETFRYSGMKREMPVGDGGEMIEVPVQAVVTPAGQKYLVALDDSVGGDVLTIRRNNSENGDQRSFIFDETGETRISLDSSSLDNVLKALRDRSIIFKKYDESSYKNQFKDAEVNYYETGNYKGFPAIVPFDLKNGWYAATKSTLPFGRNIASFDASGRVGSFYLCNVGRNNLEEFFSGIGDDTCQMINLGTGRTYSSFPGVSDPSVLVAHAVSAIEQASRQYPPENNRVRIQIGVTAMTIKVGPPAANIPDIQCQDFMSPKSCNTIFNWCDPVICPPSRCDFGGAYPVKDVIQTGIIGSSLLCLPNKNEGIKVPVCLTGIKAGIDSLLSVQDSYKKCLETGLEKGETVGICDEMNSIYMCELAWRQGIPLAKMTIPKIMSGILDQNVRGGGEYLGVRDAWDQAQASVNLFTQYYAQNSFAAFKARSTEEIGGAICKNFISANLPSGGDIINSLTEPDSPPQFHGRFDEIPFTTVTNPPISHYKVFYHIYAGADTGVYYRVYLRSGPGGSFYRDTSAIRIVDSGYIAGEEYASETKDFTAPSGYQEMCISVNGQEECGFKQVTTSFAVDYIEDQYLAEQAKSTEIKTESECVAGSASIWALLNPNRQSGIEEMIDPAIYNRGIIRFCATDNPGKATDPTAGTNKSRWVPVGYCGNKKMRCWLDTQSVRDVIETPNLITGENLGEQVVGEVTQNYLDILINENGYLKEDDIRNEIQKIREMKAPSQKISRINEILDKIFINRDKAYMYLLRGNAYRDIVLSLYPNIVERLAKKPKPAEEEDWLEKILGGGLDDFESHSFEFQDASLSRNLHYKYQAESWYWSKDGQDWISVELSFIGGPEEEEEESNTLVIPDSTEPDLFSAFETARQDATSYAQPIREVSSLPKKNQDLIFALQEKSYSEGLKLLIEKTIITKKSKLRTDGVQFYPETGFMVEISGTTDVLVYRFSDKDKWEWSAVGEDPWMKPPQTKITSGRYKDYQISAASKELIKNLIDQEFFEGAEIIFGTPAIAREEPRAEEVSEVSLSNSRRYIKQKAFFEKYAKENLPSRWQENEFKALLVSISQMESGIGGVLTGPTTSDPGETWLMGYTDGGNYPASARGPDNQVKLSSNTLKRAIEGTNTYYSVCQEETDKEELVRCVLSVYATGKPPGRTWYTLWMGKDKGAKYANTVMKFWETWKDYFTTRELYPSDEEADYVPEREQTPEGIILSFDLEDEEWDIDSRVQDVLDKNAEYREACPVTDPAKLKCAEYITFVFDYVFGPGRSNLLGVTGDSIDFDENMIYLGGEEIEITSYDDLRLGDILGLGTAGFTTPYTHVGLYLGKHDGEYMVTHRVIEVDKVEPISKTLEKWGIRRIFRPNQENLYISPKNYVEKYGFVGYRYIVESGDDLTRIGKKFSNNDFEKSAIIWLSKKINNVGDLIFAGTKLTLYIPANKMPVLSSVDADQDLKEGLSTLSNSKSQEEIGEWEIVVKDVVSLRKVSKTSTNYAIILTIIEKESSFKENPDLDMEGVCKRGKLLYKAGCALFSGTVDSIKTERDYIESRFQGFKKLTSVGAMQINIETAKAITNRDGAYFSEDELYQMLLLKENGVYFGVEYLKPLLETYPLSENPKNLKFIFADYNAGPYRSRNAALQKKMNIILGVERTPDALVTDGVLGKASAEVIENITRQSVEMDDGIVVGSDTIGFESSSIYGKINREYRKVTHLDPNTLYALVPDVTIESPKYDKPQTVSLYVENSLKFFKKYCDKMAGCNVAIS